MLALGGAFMLAALASANGPLLTGHTGHDPVLNMMILVLVEIGWFTALLTGARLLALLTTERGLTGLSSLVNGARVTVAAFTFATVLKLAVLVVTGGAVSLELGLVAMLALVATSLPLLLRGWSSGQNALQVLGASRPSLAVRTLPVLSEAHPIFRAAADRPPVLLVLTCLLTAVSAYSIGAMPDGLWPGLVSAWGPLYAGGLCAGLDVIAVLACYRLLGNLVGIRSDSARRAGLGGDTP